MSFLNAPKPFLETNAWQHGQNNSLRYNTSQAGSVLPLVYGTTRQQVNLIGFGDYRGPSGKKGKNGPLPIQGAHVGKGGGGGGKKGAGGKKSPDFSIDVAFALCQGPVDIGDQNFVWASAGVAFFQSVGLNLYTGEYGQAADPTFVGLGEVVAYSGTCYVTGTPMDLGASPVIPNLSFEITGFETGTAGPNFPRDANAGNVVLDFLTNPEHGAGWPADNLDPNLLTTYGTYCQAALLAISPALQVQTEAASWLHELTRLTNSAIVWSGAILKFVPYGDIELEANGVTWTPNLVPEYSLNDDNFLPWTPHLDTAEPIQDDDPVLITRSNPADATNWVSIEYLDRENFYNKTLIPQFDQGSIDLYGLRTEPSIQGNCFCNKTSASISSRLILQRALYVRNTYKFQLGWRFALLEPMDIVLLTDEGCGLNEQPVRITSIEENENGDLIFEAEEIQSDVLSPPQPIPEGSIYLNGVFVEQFPPLDTTASPTGTLSVWLFLDQDVGQEPILTTWADDNLDIVLDTTTGKISFRFAGSGDSWEGSSAGGIVRADGDWHNFICSWDTSDTSISPVSVVYDRNPVPINVTSAVGSGFDVDYNVDSLVFCGNGGLFGFSGITAGVQDYWFFKGVQLDLTDPDNVAKFVTGSITAMNLGANGEIPTGSPPTFFFRADYHPVLADVGTQFATNLGTAGAVSSIAGSGSYNTILTTPY